MNAMIEAVRRLKHRQDRGALAALRAGLGQPGSSNPRMYPHVVPYLPQDISRWAQEASFLTAALFASHPGEGKEGVSLGSALRTLARRRGTASLEGRFVALLDAPREDVPAHLRHAVSLLAAEDIDFDWSLLLKHVIHWGDAEGWVQRVLARDYWAPGSDAGNGED